jgi:hypothetical protein
MSCCHPQKSKAARVGGSLLDLLVLGVLIAIGVEAGHWLAQLNVAADPHARHWLHIGRRDLVGRELAMLTSTFAYLIAATLAGAGWLMNRLPTRVQIPLGSPLAWIVLLFLGSLVGLLALPVLLIVRPLQLVKEMKQPYERPNCSGLEKRHHQQPPNASALVRRPAKENGKPTVTIAA